MNLSVLIYVSFSTLCVHKNEGQKHTKTLCTHLTFSVEQLVLFQQNKQK